MTRKKYTHKMQNLILAIAKHPDSKGLRIGPALRHAQDYAKEIGLRGDSYESAWNCEPVMWARKHYGVN